MDHTYQSTMLMPASYAVLSEEEMTYLDGGADYNFNVGKYTVTFHPEVLVTYAMNVVVNGVYMLSQGSFQYFINTFKEGDAFFAGTVIGLTYGKNLPASCEIGSRLAASVISITENVCPRFRPLEFGLDIPVLD